MFKADVLRVGFDWRLAAGGALVAAAMVLNAGVGQANTIVQFDNNFGASLSEGDVLFDFDSVDPGNGLFDFGGGLTGRITTGDLGSKATGDVVVFDTTAGSTSVGNDPDLLGPFTNVNNANDILDFGNALILNEKNGAGHGPDDAANGGAITFTFDLPVLLTAVFILDGADNSPNGASIFVDGAATALATGLGGGDRQFEVFDNFDPNTTVTSLTVDFAGSGAIGRFGATVVPVPAALPLLLTGLGAFALIARRKGRQSAA